MFFSSKNERSGLYLRLPDYHSVYFPRLDGKTDKILKLLSYEYICKNRKNIKSRNEEIVTLKQEQQPNRFELRGLEEQLLKQQTKTLKIIEIMTYMIWNN